MNKIFNICLSLIIILASLAAAQDVIVCHDSSKFYGWPANEGIWSWGNEIVVGFNEATYLYNPDGHSYDTSDPIYTIQARSTDGGSTWSIERPTPLQRSKAALPMPSSINYTHPDFAMKIRKSVFWISYDKAQTWMGPFDMPDFDLPGSTSRTDYILDSQSSALMFLSVKKPDDIEGRTMVAQTVNGGRTINFLSFIAPCPDINVGDHYYTIMPSSVRISEDELIVALRTREGTTKVIEIYSSEDNGKSWEYLSTPVTGAWNPPSMIKLSDGRICLTYGYRSSPMGIRAKISSNDGQSWGSEINLRTDAASWDMGYPRSIQRSDGKVVTVYYYTTSSTTQQHIAATIWQP